MNYPKLPSFRLDRKRALVTGAGRGIGMGASIALAESGANVTLVSITEEELKDLTDHINKQGHKASYRVLDVNNENAVSDFINDSDPFDILINNAGTNPSGGSLMDVELSAVQKTWDVNLMGPLMWTREAVKAGLKESVLNVCSVGGIKPSHYMGAYNISKAGLIYMTKQLAMELAPDIRVNGIAPAVVKTKLSEMLWAGDEQGSADLHALKKLGEPEDIASLIYFLSSDDASWITGEVVTIDGGFLL